RLGIVDIAGINTQLHPQHCRIERADRGLNVDCPDAILLAFLDRESDHEPPSIWIVLCEHGDDAYVDEAVLEIKSAQQLAISLDPVRIVNVAGLQECKHKPVSEVLMTSLRRYDE